MRYRIRNPLRLMDLFGIPFLRQLWGCLRHYLKIPIEDWEVIDDCEWGLYDIESNKWIHL